MKIGNFDTDKNVFVIAEIGNNHEGDFSVAQDLIECAAAAGADAVKFQTCVPENFISIADQERLTRLREFSFSHSQIKALQQKAISCGLVFFSTPFDIESANFLNSLQTLFKIASGDNTFFPLIETVGAFGKPTLISTGLADLDLLDKIYLRWSLVSDKRKLAFLHCVSSYPVPLGDTNLGAIYKLRERYPDLTIGYSDHTIGIDAATYAVAAGARIIEKHFTIDKHHSDFRDHQLSADPDDMKMLVENIRKVEVLLGASEKKIQPSEVGMETAIRRSIAVSRDIPKGSILTFADLTWVRPGTGLLVGNESLVIGKLLNRSLRRGELILPEMLSG